MFIVLLQIQLVIQETVARSILLKQQFTQGEHWSKHSKQRTMPLMITSN